MPTTDNLTNMDTPSARRDEEIRSFIANRASAHEHAMANATHHAAHASATARRITDRDIRRVMDQHAIDHPELDIRPGNSRALRTPRRD